MIIRNLLNEELKMAVELRNRCCNEDFSEFMPKNSMNINKELEFLTEWLNDKDSSDTRRIYGAFENDVFLGFAAGSFTDKEDAEKGVELNYLFVEKAHRGKNIGLSLMKKILDEYAGYGADTLIIYSWHDSESNNLYRHLGGEVIRQIPQYPGGKEAMVDAFSWDINNIIQLIDKKLKRI